MTRNPEVIPVLYPSVDVRWRCRTMADEFGLLSEIPVFRPLADTMDADMTEVEARRVLQDGVAILKEVLAPHGFTVTSPTSGTGSGGSYASCQFSRGNRRL